MLKKFNNEENLLMDVYLKDGGKYLKCDMTTSAETNGVCKFWNGDVFMIVPWDEIKRVEIYEEDSKAKTKKRK